MTPVPPPAAYVAALASLPDVGPSRLSALLGRGDPADVLADLAGGGFAPDEALAAACRRGDPSPLVTAWSNAARSVDVAELWRRHLDRSITVLVPDDASWPVPLHVDPEPPGVLFVAGDVAVLARRPTVAVVGTRDCSRYGWDVAHELGFELARAGVVVVSGLAKGIDAAAHRGALDGGGAPPVGVVATGLDVAYPRENRDLWSQVEAAGALVSEAPLGTTPSRWRFPARNRVIAALADAVVVVESPPTGGALHTVDEALRRDRPVFAVPGPVTSRRSLGTNRLLAEAALPLCDPADVLLAVGVAPPSRRSAVAPEVTVGDADALAVLDALGFTDGTLDDVAGAAGLPLGATAAALARLEAGGVLSASGGRWHRSSAAVEVTP